MPGKRKESRAAANLRGRSSSAPAKRSALDHLKPAEAAAVLRRLLDEKRDLVPEAEALAMAMLCGTSMDDVADAVEDALDRLEMDDLASRSGKRAGGYTHPSEAAGELLEETIAPFFEQMDRLLALDLEEDALECCRGIVVGFYRARDLEDGEALGWAPDCIAESACNALVAWHAGGTEHMFGPGSCRRREERAFPAKLIAPRSGMEGAYRAHGRGSLSLRTPGSSELLSS